MGLALEFDAHNLQTIKLGVHIAQAVLIFVTWALEIDVFHNAKSIDGRPGWYFGLVGSLVLLHIPTPTSTRTSRSIVLREAMVLRGCANTGCVI